MHFFAKRQATPLETKRINEENERKAKSEEAARINDVVAERLRAYAEANNVKGEDIKPVRSVTHDGSMSAPQMRRQSHHGRIDRSGHVSKKECAKINNFVKKREHERRARQSEPDMPTRSISIADEEADDEDSPPTTPATPGDAISFSAPPVRRPTYRGGKYSSRERLAELQREADERKCIAKGIDPNNPPTPPGPAPTTNMIGTARAAAKIAGGVFYTYAENSELLTKAKMLKKQNLELQAKLDRLERIGASIAKEAMDETIELQHDKNASPAFLRGTSPGFLRGQTAELLLRAMSSALAAVSSDSPSFIRRARRLSGTARSLNVDGTHNAAVLIRPPSA